VSYDAIFVLSFGGPQSREEVIPFLEHVLRGKRVPVERLETVAEHYYHFDGVSPNNAQIQRLSEHLSLSLEQRFPEQKPLPVYVAHLHAAPFLEEVMQKMADDGIESAIAVLTAGFTSAASCRKYLNAIEAAKVAVGPKAPKIDKIRPFHNHPGFIAAQAERTQEALASIGGSARLAFTAHSIPMSMANCSSYVQQLEDSCQMVAKMLSHEEWQLVFQSRSGPPMQPWLEPDICDHLKALHSIGVESVVVSPIGFICDHMEVMWDLDVEAKQVAKTLGLQFARAGTVGTHPKFVQTLTELVGERFGQVEKRRTLGQLGPSSADCLPGCCLPLGE
jgi:ferrochelatase